MTDEPRIYRMGRRAASQLETRRRITESAVAERAGVRRSTLYRHFPDEGALFEACSAHWNAANPLPDLGAWSAIGAPEERLEVGLGELYGFYSRTAAMLERLFRDEQVSPLVRERFAAFRGYLGAAADALMAGRPERGARRRRRRAAIGHAIAFSTWHSLVREQGLSEDQAVALMCMFAATVS